MTENGVAVPDKVESDGAIHDPARTRFIREHLVQVQRAIREGVPVRGYFLWSLLDNFEWSHGYTMRFGVNHVDYETQRRTLKDSGKWYAQVARENGIEEE